MDAFWASLGALILASPRHGFVKSVAGQHQVSVRERNDTVMLVGIDQMRGWHEMDLPCHGMARFDLFDLSLTSASGGDGVVR
jgi:hypothetical protein